MAETLLIMDKTLTSSVKRYKKEKRTVLDEVSSTDSFLSEARKYPCSLLSIDSSNRNQIVPPCISSLYSSAKDESPPVNE